MKYTIYSSLKFIPAVSIYNQSLLQDNLQNQPKPTNKFYFLLNQTAQTFDYCGKYGVQTCSNNFFKK